MGAGFADGARSPLHECCAAIEMKRFRYSFIFQASVRPKRGTAVPPSTAERPQTQYFGMHPGPTSGSWWRRWIRP